MFDLNQNLGVQSWCFREFKAIPALIEQVKGIGLSRVELCGVHADFNDPASFASVIAQFRKAGVEISSIGVQYFEGKPEEEKWFEFARAAGAKLISTSFVLAALPRVLDVTARLAEKHGILLGIHNHGGYDWLGNFMMLEHLMKHQPPHIGICIDTAWCLQAAGNPVEWAEKFTERLYGVHLKDFVFDRAGKWSDVIVGTGNLDLAAFLKKVQAAPNLVALTLEYEGDAANPGPKLKDCVAAVRAIG